MKRIIILLIAALFMMISGCQKKTDASKEDAATNDIVMQLIKEEALTNGGGGDGMDTNAGLMENIPGHVVLNTPERTGKTKTIPDEPVVGEIRNKSIKDIPVEIPEKTEEVSRPQKGTYLKIGNDQNGQTVSRKKVVKFTTVVLGPVKNSKFVDYSIFAIPYGKKKGILLTRVYNIEVINGQSQFTRYWNGKNISGKYIPAGKYRLMVYITMKNAAKKTLKTEERYWGMGADYYIRLK